MQCNEIFKDAKHVPHSLCNDFFSSPCSNYRITIAETTCTLVYTNVFQNTASSVEWGIWKNRLNLTGIPRIERD